MPPEEPAAEIRQRTRRSPRPPASCRFMRGYRSLVIASGAPAESRNLAAFYVACMREPAVETTIGRREVRSATVRRRHSSVGPNIFPLDP
jgi:hypothetical protein